MKLIAISFPKLQNHRRKLCADLVFRNCLILHMYFQIQGKYDKELASDVMQWVGQTLPDAGISGNGEMDYVHDKLKDGYELCRYVVPYCPFVVTHTKIYTPRSWWGVRK